MLSNTSLPIEIKKIELLDATFRYNLNQITKVSRVDQTQTPIGECAIEFVLKKIMLWSRKGDYDYYLQPIVSASVRDAHAE